MISDDLSDDDVAEMAGDGTNTHLTFVRAAMEIRRRRTAEHTVPPLIAAGLDRYAQHGLPPGDCLRAILEGNLYRAYACADHATWEAMGAIVTAITSRLHSSTWGSPEAVSRYLARMDRLSRAGVDRTVDP